MILPVTGPKLYPAPYKAGCGDTSNTSLVPTYRKSAALCLAGATRLNQFPIINRSLIGDYDDVHFVSCSWNLFLLLLILSNKWPTFFPIGVCADGIRVPKFFRTAKDYWCAPLSYRGSGSNLILVPQSLVATVSF